MEDLLRKSLLSMLFNRHISDSQILKIDNRLLPGVYGSILKQVKKELLDKKDFSEQTVAIELADEYDTDQVVTIIGRCKKMQTSKKNFEDTVEKLVNINFRKEMEARVHAVLSLGKQASNERMLAEINKIAAMRPFSKSGTLDIIINRHRQEIIDGDDIIKFTGFLGDICGGFTRGEMSVWGARPGGGKTNSVINVCDYVATNHPDLVVLVLSREMTNSQLIKRLLLLNSEGTILYDDLRTGEPLKGEKKKLAEEIMGRMADKYKNLIIVDDVRTIDDGVSAILTHMPDLVIDDFIGIIEDEEMGADKTRHLINKVLKTYKWLAKKLNAHVMNISQLNRNIEMRLEPEPIMSDFNESGLIEQLCELVIVQTRRADEALNYWVLKARHGKPKTVGVKYEPAWCKIHIGEDVLST